MPDEEKSRELTRSNFAAQMAMLGYEPDGSPKDMVEVVRCKDCKNVCMCDTSEILPGIPIYAKCSLTDKVHKPEWFCADGERKEGR